MDRESLRELRLDRRLIGRRGWISDEEIARELAALPDVSHKIAPIEAGPSKDGAEEPSPPEPPEAASPE